MSLNLPRNLQEAIRSAFREWHEAWGHGYPHDGPDPSTHGHPGTAIAAEDIVGDTGVSDHGALTGLADDDHAQYVLESAHADPAYDAGHHARYTDAEAVAAVEGVVDVADLVSGSATDGQVATADGAGGVAWEDAAAGGAALSVQEEDGTPIDTAVTIIRVPNGGLTDNGAGDVSLGYVTPAGVQNSSHVYAADSVGTDAYAITLTPAVTAYVTGQVFHFKAGAANTGAATLNVNGLGAVPIKKARDQDLVTGDIESAQIVTVVYDGTNFQMQSQTAALAKSYRIHKLKPEAAPNSAISAGTEQDFSYVGPSAETIVKIAWVCKAVGTALSFTLKHSNGDNTYTTGQSWTTINTQAIGTSQGDTDDSMTGTASIPAESLITLDIDSFTGDYKDLTVFIVTTLATTT